MVNISENVSRFEALIYMETIVDLIQRQVYHKGVRESHISAAIYTPGIRATLASCTLICDDPAPLSITRLQAGRYCPKHFVYRRNNMLMWGVSLLIYFFRDYAMDKYQNNGLLDVML